MNTDVCSCVDIFHWEKYIEVGLLDSMINILLILWNTAESAFRSWYLCHLDSHRKTYKNYCCFSLLVTLMFIRYFIFILVGMLWRVIVILILIFLMNCNINHLSCAYLLALYLLLCSRLCPFKIRLFIFPIDWFLKFLYIFHIQFL